MQLDNQLLYQEFRNLPYNTLIQLFFGLVIFDIITLYAKSLKLKEPLASYQLVTHLLVIILVIVSYPYLALLGIFKDLLVSFYAVHYALSSIQNLNELGAPVPEVIVEALTKLKHKKPSHQTRKLPCSNCPKIIPYKKDGNPNRNSRPPTY